MFQLLSRHIYKTVHLIHTKPDHVATVFYNPRGMPITPRTSVIAPPSQVLIKLTQPFPIAPCAPVEHTLYPAMKELVDDAKTVKATRKFLRTSVKKLWPIIKPLKGLHVEDAMQTLDVIRRKPAEWVKNIIRAGIRSAVNIKGMHEDRLYIKYFLLGKNKGIKGIRRHAKSRMGEMLRPKAQVTVVIQERSVKDLYQIINDGKFSPAIALSLRMMLVEGDAGLSDIQRLQHYLTAKGRQQQKLMFKRKVFLYVEEKKKEGIIMSQEHAKQLILDQESKVFEDNYWNHKKTEVEKKIAERLEIFNKNQKNR